MAQTDNKQGVLFQLNGRPPLSKAALIGLQHVFAMFIGNLAPILLVCGVLASVSSTDRLMLIQGAMLMSGIATLLQIYPIKLGKRFRIGSGLPVVMGTSFAFVPTMLVLAPQYGIAGILGGSLVGGVVGILLSIFIKPLKRFFPPVVIGSVIVTIGINLLLIGGNYFAGGVGSPTFGSIQNLGIGFLVFLIITLLNRFAKGMLKAVGILIGIAVGYLVSAFLGMVDFSTVAAAPWFSLPRPLYFMPQFHFDAILAIAVVYIIIMLETMGNTAGITIATMDRDISTQEASGGIAASALSSMLGTLFGALPNAAFGQNAGIVSMTKVINRFAVATSAVIMISIAFLPKIGELFSAMPASVLGGAIISVFAMIFINGIKMITRNGIDEKKALTLAVTFGLGYGLGILPSETLAMPPVLSFIFKEPVTAVCVTSILANILFTIGKKSNDKTPTSQLTQPPSSQT